MSAGGGIKINNIKVSGGADGKTPVFKIEDGYLFNSYDNGKTWHQLGKVKGEDGVDGEDGATGAKLVSQVLVGQDASGGNIYKQTFDDGTTAIFVAPKGKDGVDGEVTIATIEINNPNTTLAFKNLEGMTEIDWGDGTINSELTHTYENLGVYYCRIYGLVSIGEEAFKGSIPSSNYTPITHIKISNKVTSIGDNAFTYTKLRSIEIPNSVTYIGSSFDQSHYLEKIVIPESVTHIDVDAFNMCSNLKIVELKGAPPQQIYSGDIFSFANKLEKIIVPYGMVEAYKSAPMWSDYAKLIDRFAYQSDLDTVNADLRSLIGGNTSLMLSNTERITAVEEKITENREEINKDIKNLYAITAQGGLYTMLEVEQAFVSRETADGENIVDGQYTAPTKIQGSTVACKNLFDKNLALDGYEIINATSGTLGVSAEWFTTDYIPVRPNTSYVVSGKPDGSTVMAYNSNKEVITNLRDGISGFRTTENAAFVRLNGLLIQKDTFQLEEGTTATDYQPYFTGLKNAYLQSIKSTGRNLIPPYAEMPEVSNGVAFTKNVDGSIRVKGLSTMDNFVPLATGLIFLPNWQYTLSGYRGGADGDSRLHIDWNGVASYNDWGDGVTFNAPNTEKTATIYFHIAQGITYDITLYPMLNFGASKLPYEPYKEEIYELPEAVELGKWDYIDIENKKVVRKTYQLTVNGDGAGQYKAQIMMYQNSDGIWSILCPFHGNEGGRAMTAGRDGVVVAQNNICEYAEITGGYPDSGYTTLQLVGVQVTTVEEAKALLAANPITFAYETFANSKITDLEETPKRYQAWKNGSETVLQGDTDNSEYGAMPTVTTEYFKLTEV